MAALSCRPVAVLHLPLRKPCLLTDHSRVLRLITFILHFSACFVVVFFYQPLSVRGWASAFHLNIHRLCGAIEGRLSHFLPRWLRTGWQSAISQGKIT